MKNGYTYRIVWSEADKEHVGLCAEFPSLSHLDADPKQALAGIMNLVADVVEDMRISGEIVPEPISARHYSGRILARVAPEIHRHLALEAAEHQMSMNRWISYRLTAPCR
jgi:ribosomal protein L11 methylase PrmA